MSEEFYVYEHTRNDTNKIFYVGKGKAGSGRSSFKHNRNPYWHNIVKKTGYTVRKTAENISEKLAFEKEIQRIKELREQGVSLCNFTDGGEGISGYRHTDEGIAKITAAQTGKKFSDKTRARISASKTGEKNPLFGKKHSEEHRQKISEANTGHKTSDKVKAKISAANKGREFSEEHKRKISEVQQGKTFEERLGKEKAKETKKKMSEARIGRRFTKEHKKNLSKAHLSIPILTCPHCGKSSRTNMKRYHFDNCRNK